MIIVTSLAPPLIRSASSWAVTAPSLDLRHTCASSLLGRGVHPKLVHHHLGHASITMTLDRYSRWIATMGRHSADGMDEALVSYCCPIAAKPSITLLGAVLFLQDLQEKRRADGRTRTGDLVALRVCGRRLLSVAQDCESHISKLSFVPSIARYCRVLRPG
jgi:hypothetical protein